MIEFLKRNWRELAWVAANVLFASGALWMATAQPDHDKALDLWMGAVCYVLFMCCGGYWAWAIFDNADMDAREAAYAEMHREWRKTWENAE